MLLILRTDVLLLSHRVSPAQKRDIHESWMRNETQVVVATIAFGLGINKP
jgi:superfamily II DNA helicase RecQ